MRLKTLLASLLLLSTANVAYSQLLAFPGAEGVARHVTGGRGGDVYKVTNLNDSGVGSLRHGLQNAPTAGRTIVFDVAGTIHLSSDLSITRDNITIAGQTAPAGGITLAGRQLRVNNTENVIVQFLRVRPGHSDGAGDPDAIWVSGSNGVMLDHITASWGVDETISTTHNSNNVTVQWSTLSQALYEGGHSKGDGHSYGSLINGGAYSYHHNLYAHNKSRNPRAQASGNYLRLDFVNNVMFNPQDRFGYNDSDDPYDVNLVGNYAIKGPKSNSNNYLFDSKDADSHYHVAGNFTDIDKDGLLDGAAVDGDGVFRPGGAYTLFPSRLSAAQLPVVATHSASEAYLHVLSRAGAINYRDPVDRQLIRSVMNQLEYSINTEDDIGGLPTLPTGTAPSDSNGDGVPDSFAASLGFAPTTNLAATYTPSGYSYLEEYLHSLTPFAYAPTNTETIAISTADGRGADATVSEAGGGTGDGLGPTLSASWAGASGATNDVTVLKFDLSAIEAGSVAAASLELTAAASAGRSQRFRLYGLEHDAADWDWDEATIDFDSAPGLIDDGNPGTLGIDPAYNASNPTDIPGVLSLGELNAGPFEEGQTVTFDNPNLGVFVNLAAFFEGAAQEGVVTLLLESTTSNGAAFYSKEGSAEFAPRLVLEATASPGLPGDFNSDGVVNAADYTVWRDNTSGEYTPADYPVWASNYGRSVSTVTTVPEPCSLMLVATLLVGGVSRRR
ncbi:DNRLRE domain-containing protein [Botrimarina mediterranea]|uniref:Pectate lyase n=1 Tax=Botrimarina mediterranea TaxID=2528022 RepID=A0A518K2E7_9BACT|nr:DNRLRE domain-containing protein [Botrimarina mediterranea]QDV71981.1 Pectate lyase [Botrimarina mediterranea]